MERRIQALLTKKGMFRVNEKEKGEERPTEKDGIQEDQE